MPPKTICILTRTSDEWCCIGPTDWAHLPRAQEIGQRGTEEVLVSRTLHAPADG